MENKDLFFEQFNNSLHRLGRALLIGMICLLVAVPLIFGVLNGITPNWSAIAGGLAKVCIIYFPVSVVEFLVYAPMLGAGGSYLSFITGNVTNMKIPCVMNAANIAKTQPGTPEHEIVSTIAAATSGIVTTFVIVAGVVLLVPLQPVLQNPVLQPAFDNVVPALFGALGLKYFSKSLYLSAPPLVLMSVICIAVPSLISQTSVMMIPMGVLALGLGFVLFKKNKL